MTTFDELLATRLRRDAGQPFITFYDGHSGERTELSVQTWANWVNKTANLLDDELMLSPGATMAVRLPTHWLGPVFLGAAWLTDITVLWAEPGAAAVDSASAEVVVVGPTELEYPAPQILACSLTPFATRFTTALPAGVLDFGLLWPGQDDVFFASDPVTVTPVSPSDERTLTDVNPLSQPGRELLLAALAGSGSLVLLHQVAEAEWPAHYDSERATRTLRAQGSA